MFVVMCGTVTCKHWFAAGLHRGSSNGTHCSSLYISTASTLCSMKCEPTSDVLRYVLADNSGSLPLLTVLLLWRRLYTTWVCLLVFSVVVEFSWNFLWDGLWGKKEILGVIWRWEVSHCKTGHYQCMHARVVNFPEIYIRRKIPRKICLLYTSDAADE